MTKKNDDLKPAERPKILEIRDFLFQRHDYQLNVVANDVERSPKGKNECKTVSDEQISFELYRAGFKGFEKQLVALLRSEEIPTVDPIKSYFDGLPAWTEDEPDYIGQLASYVDALDPNWFRLMFRKALVRTVACAVGHIPFNKQCLVLYSMQNDGKSSFLRSLCPPALRSYYTEHVNPSSKDGLISLTSNFIINLDELKGISKQEADRLKSFFTTATVKVRRPYGKKDSLATRRASFFGSTNNSEILTDETGNVRWIIFEIAGINHDNGGPNGYCSVAIDRVWSQAYALMKSGFEFQMDKSDLKISEEINRRKFFRGNAATDMIPVYLEPSDRNDPEAEFLNATQITAYLMEVMENRIRFNENLVGRALTFLQFPKTQDRHSGDPRRGYWVKKISSFKNMATSGYNGVNPLKEKDLRVATF